MGFVKRAVQIIESIRTGLTAASQRVSTPLARYASPAIAVLARIFQHVQRFLCRRTTQRVLHIVSIVLVLSVFGAYLADWLEFNEPMLSNPDLQSDDARTIIFPFHRYDSDPALEQDPIADEMLALVPIGVRLLYRVLVPFTDVFIAPKIVQGLAFALVLFAGAVLWRARRGGLAAGILLVFFVYHDWFAIERISGGLPRAFGFPCFALWLAGVLSHKRWARFLAPVLSALTYPSVMLMILAAEGLYSVRDLGRVRPRVVWRRLRRYMLILGTCVLAVLPAAMGSDDRGPVHTLEQAQLEPAFGRAGRLWILPFAEPTKVFLEAYIDQLLPHGESPLPRVARAYGNNPEVWATTFFAGLLIIGLLRLSPSPQAAVAFTAGAVILYLLSRVLAFALYSPERFYSYGMRMAAIVLLVAVPARLFPALRSRPRAIVNNLIGAALLMLVWSTTGNGQKHPSGMFLNANHDRALHEFVKTLPKDVRIATHPMDGDGIPYFSARATMGTFETLQPWFVDSWHRQKDRCYDTLKALYATRRQAVLDYAARRGVTHILINQHRYRSNFVAKSASFQPFSNFAKHLLSNKRRQDLVLTKVPSSAIVFDQDKWQLVDVARLRKAWGTRE